MFGNFFSEHNFIKYYMKTSTKTLHKMFFKYNKVNCEPRICGTISIQNKAAFSILSPANTPTQIPCNNCRQQQWLGNLVVYVRQLLT